MAFRPGMLFCTLLLMSAALALPSQAISPPATSASDTATNKQVPRCRQLDAQFFQSLPGAVANCYGKRKWMKGHYDSSIADFKLAAGWGSKDAQYSLGLIYYNGRHVDTNKALGIAWLELAAERDDAHKDLVTRSAKKLATPQERKHAQKILANLSLRYADKVAAKRAWKHFQHWGRYKEVLEIGTVVPKCGNIPPGANPAAMAANAAAEARCRFEEMTDRSVKSQRNSLVSKYFQGWIGNVTVGPLQEDPAPASSGN